MLGRTLLMGVHPAPVLVRHVGRDRQLDAIQVGAGKHRLARAVVLMLFGRMSVSGPVLVLMRYADLAHSCMMVFGEMYREVPPLLDGRVAEDAQMRHEHQRRKHSAPRRAPIGSALPSMFPADHADAPKGRQLLFCATTRANTTFVPAESIPPAYGCAIHCFHSASTAPTLSRLPARTSGVRISIGSCSSSDRMRVSVR